MRRLSLVILSVTVMFVVLLVGAINIGKFSDKALGINGSAVKPLVIAQQTSNNESDSNLVEQTSSSPSSINDKRNLKKYNQVYSPNAFKLQYLGVNGAFTIDPTEISATDPRNPKLVVFDKMEYFSFYDDLEKNKPIAESCRYLYRGAVGDPFYYPTQSKTSIWDLFELVSPNDACNKFYYLTLRSPHGALGEPVHMHLRYGDASSSFATVLNISNLGPEDKTKIDPWWSVYCTQGESGCDS